MKKKATGVSIETGDPRLSFFDSPTQRTAVEDWLGHSPEATLIVGHPGSGKSTFAVTFPYTYIWCADNKMGGLPDKSKKRLRTFKHGDPVHALAMGLLDSLTQEKIEQMHIKTLVIDTMTSFSEMMEVEILNDELLNKDHKQALQIQHYNIIGLRIQDLIRKCKEVGLDLVVITHMDEAMLDDGTSVFYPNVTGKKQELKLAGKFDHVVYMTAGQDGKYKARMKPSNSYPQAKISVSKEININAPAIVTDLTYTKFRKILNGTIKKAAAKKK